MKEVKTVMNEATISEGKKVKDKSEEDSDVSDDK
jgi:hypothetical protein